MPSLRTFIRRILLGLGGAALLAVAAIVGFWWVVTEHVDWLSPFLEEQDRTHLYVRIVSMRLARSSIDSDGDGIPDWFEKMTGTDPRNGTHHSGACVLGRHGDRFLVYAEERTRIRTRMSLPIPFTFSPSAWPIGFHAQASANQPVLLPADGLGPATKGPLEIVATRHGDLEFDVLVPANNPEHLIVTLNNPSNGESLAGVFIWSDTLVSCVGKRMPTVPSTVVLRSLDGAADLDIYYRDVPSPDGHGTIVLPLFGPPDAVPHLTWKPVPGATAYVLEVARTDQPEHWIPHRLTNDLTPGYECINGTGDGHDAFPEYTGKLLYRIVPVTQTPLDKSLSTTGR